MIEVSHLTKKYGANRAVDDLSFTIDKGVIYGLLGPNGAGKSTTMNIITGCLGATSGEVRVGGHSVMDEPMEAKKLIGYLPEQPPLYQEMTPKEYLRFVAQAKGIPHKEWNSQLHMVMEKTRIVDVQDRLIRNLSKGYKQRVGIAQALLGNPEVIILDEPTVGLDPKQIIEIRELIRELGKEHTLVLSSHILSEVQAVCDHIMIISKGHLVASDTPENLTSLFAGTTTIKLEAMGDADAVRSLLSTVDGIETAALTTEDGVTRCELTQSGEEDVRAAIFTAFADAKLPILEMTRVRASLEDVFLELTSGEAAAIQPEPADTVDETEVAEE
ncbi:MAG: ABC transporter ATP-binding protein [Clostridia bacterium]|nr:ABC transporter ATP-binding protein [Clostridia bacterium]